MTYAYKLGTRDKCESLALLFRGIIKRAFTESMSLPWPTPPDDLEIKSSYELLPPGCVKFLNFHLTYAPLFYITGSNCVVIVLVVNHFLTVLGHLPCYDEGRMETAKHMLLCTTLRHLYRSKHLTTILSRLGHCETYQIGLEQHWPKLWMMFSHRSLPRLLLARAMMCSILSGTNST